MISISILFIVFVLLILFLLSLKTMKASEFNIFKLYLWLVSLVAIIWFTIFIWVLSYKYINLKLISDEEYINWTYSYEINSCKDPSYMWGKFETQDSVKVKTEEEINKCVESKTKELKLRRAYDYKDNIIMSWVWAVIFLLLFSIHFPFFIRKTE